MFYLTAVVTGQCSVKDLVVVADEANRACPIVALRSPVGVCLVARVPGQPGCELKEGPLRQSLLVVIPLVEGENLPAQTTATIFRIPTTDLVIENIDSQVEPGWGGGRVGKLEFRCPHGC